MSGVPSDLSRSNKQGPAFLMVKFPVADAIFGVPIYLDNYYHGQ